MSDTSDLRPSKKQKELLSFLDAFIAGHGYGPSYREVMQGLGYKSVSTVAVHIDGLIAKGYLRKGEGYSARSLEMTTPQHSGENPVDEREKWLMKEIETRMRESNADEVKILVESLKILGFEEAYERMRRKLEL